MTCDVDGSSEELDSEIASVNSNKSSTASLDRAFIYDGEEDAFHTRVLHKPKIVSVVQ